ncbi:MAG TPA: VWA domain-containing protein [Gammaproteobacteria bacterium]|nr:VWA domain-containing protein [Gammaproteobacteria bacterium]
MHKYYPVSTPRMALTAALTSSVLLACAPSQQHDQTHNQIVPLPQPAIEMTAREHDKVNKLSAESSGAPALPGKLRKKNDALTYLRLPASEQRMLSTSHYAYRSSLPIRAPAEALNRENYHHFDDNGITLVAETPVSTFSIDVDTGSYSNVRRLINAGSLPREDAVRVEELVNYFSYDYPLPENDETPFSVTTEIGITPWNPDTRLMHIGIKGYDLDSKKLPASNLVFLIDVSGSMNSPDKLGLLKSALKLLSKQMRAEDKISIVVYAGASGVVLEPVAANRSADITQALDSLAAGGSTNGAAGIRSAYLLAEQAFIKDGINRVILATDGDFNVGTVNFEALKDLVEEKRKTGISLTTLGFGTGNYNDHLMEQLADAGNGNYAYIDTLNEAQKVLVDEMSSTLNTIAKDVKIQIEFNPAVVAEYRLIGYENRALKREDFNNDKVDAGDIGAGHTVTALYEITLTDSKRHAIDPLRYGKPIDRKINHSDELAHLRLRYKKPEANKSKLIEQVIHASDINTQLASMSNHYRFSASVAGFGQLLRGGKHTENFSYDDVLTLARKSRGDDNYGYRGEFISLVNLASSLSTQTEENTQADENIQAIR